MCGQLLYLLVLTKSSWTKKVELNVNVKLTINNNYEYAVNLMPPYIIDEKQISNTLLKTQFIGSSECSSSS